MINLKKRIELHAKTKYSIDHKSTLEIKNLILKCISNGERGVAIVDTESVISFYKAEKILKELNIKNFKLIYGIELNVKYLNKTYQVVVLLKNKKGIPSLFRILSPYHTNKILPFEDLIQNRKNFVIGLLYNQDIYNDNILEHIDYIEINKNTPKETIKKLKEKTTIIYSNQINALSNEEELSKRITYNKLNIKDEIENRIYQTTEEVLNEFNDREIVIDNSNKIFDMIENFELINNDMLLPSNEDFDIDLLVYIILSEKYNNDIPTKIRKRVEEELKLIHKYNYDGYINLYKKIIDKCKEENEEYVIYDYINYLYIAYLLKITHFNPIKLDLNYDIFFSNYPKINLKLSSSFSKKLSNYIKNDLNINTIKCKSLMKLMPIIITKTYDIYEEKNNIKLTNKEKNTITKHLKDYPINNRAITSKELIIPTNFNIYEISPCELINDGKKYHRFTNIDYKDIEHKFITLELIANDKITKLNQLKEITEDKITNCNYKDKFIINKKKFKDHLKIYDKDLILDDLYKNLIDSNIELTEIFNIINEIKKNKNISKKTKELLDKNFIKLNKYSNINLISRGILNEKIRLEYELLYFKIYYPKEYYYIMLKDCPFNNLIEITKKGYDEVLSKIKEYQEYQYEYNYLNFVKELYESNIDFSIDKRMIIEDFHYELDKENNQITLVLNKINEEINKYLSNDISLIGTRPVNGKMSYMSKVMYKLLDNNKNITLFSLNNPTNFYIEYLLSEITGIDKKTIQQYLNPCSHYKNNILSIDEIKYMNGLKYLLNHNLSIHDNYSVNTTIIDGINKRKDKIIYMIKNSNSNLIIIDNIEYLKKDLKNILKQLKKISKEKNINFIIFTNLKREYEENYKQDISSFENNKLLNKYINYINILDEEKLYTIKEGKKI